MSSSDLSSLSSAPPSDDEADKVVEKSINRAVGLERYFKVQTAKEPSPDAPAPREQSPPHDYVLADNEIVAFVVMFRSRFTNAFPKSLPHYGPQDIEKGVSDPIPTEQVERLLCALLGQVLNRKKDVEKGHYSRALEEAVVAHSSQWPKTWEGKNPLHGGRSFITMSPEERLVLLRTLILWSLSSSESIQAILKESYKQSRHDDDLNQPLSVQPWGRDAYKRRYWLIEGQDDTHFRVYRESNPALKRNAWWSIAGSIDEVKSVAENLEKDPSQHAKRLREQIKNAIPRFEASEEKRKRRDYRLARKAQFTRPEPGFSLYEGRTRGKKLKYTFSDDDEDDTSDAISTRRSTRQSGISTPAEPSGPTFTASGRQVKVRQGGTYGESMLSSQRKTESSPIDGGPNVVSAGSDVDSEGHISTSRPQRVTRAARPGQTNAWRKGDDHIEDYNSVDEMDDEEDAASSGDNWDGDDDEKEDFAGDEEEEQDEEDEDMSQSDEEVDDKHLIVQLRYRKGESKSRSATGSRNNSGQGGVNVPAFHQPKTQSAMPTPMEMTPNYLSPNKGLAPSSDANGVSVRPTQNVPALSHAHPASNRSGPPTFNQSLNSHPVISPQPPGPNFIQSNNQPHSSGLPIHPPQPQSPSYPHHPNGISQSG